MTARAFASLEPGETATWTHEITAAEVDAFAELSGDVNPLHMDDDYARRQGFKGRVVHGMLLGAFVSRVLGTVLPGPGVLWLSDDVRFQRPAYIGDRIELVVRIAHKSDALRTLALETVITNERKEILLSGEAKMMMLGQAEAVPWEDMVCLITGSSRGIGAAVARRLGAKGARVIVNYREQADAAEAVVAEVEQAGGQAAAVKANVSNPEGAKQLAEAALGTYGRLDVIVSNATPSIERKPIDELSWEELDAYWRTYVQSTFTLAQLAIPGMKERGFGRLINILTSAMWGTPPANTAGYVAAKSGLWGLARGMAVELAPHGITVNGVSPSAVLTEQWSGESDRRRRAVAMSLPARRLASPDEVAAAVVYLAGPEAAYITGANLPVAGGEVMI